MLVLYSFSLAAKRPERGVFLSLVLRKDENNIKKVNRREKVSTFYYNIKGLMLHNHFTEKNLLGTND